jgi:hypothetical protein
MALSVAAVFGGVLELAPLRTGPGTLRWPRQQVFPLPRAPRMIYGRPIIDFTLSMPGGAPNALLFTACQLSRKVGKELDYRGGCRYRHVRGHDNR